MSVVKPRSAELTEQHDTVSDDLAEILEGLSRAQKMLSPKFFYDKAGSRLFDKICELPEYYPTRTELAIMETHASEIASRVGPHASLIEFGSGSSLKIRVLLEHLDRPAAYVPVDISKEHLVATANSLANDFPQLEILPVVADITHPFPLPDPRVTPLRNLVYFPGSTIGNFAPDAALELLKVMHYEAGEDGALLIGIDLKKDKTILERAYNDSAGVTAAFNLNILKRLNREFDADFDLAQFDHKAFYNSEFGRVEMHLVSRRQQQVTVHGHVFDFMQGESILTEHSHKYTLKGFTEMTAAAGFDVENAWTDPAGLFSVLYCSRLDLLDGVTRVTP